MFTAFFFFFKKALSSTKEGKASVGHVCAVPHLELMEEMSSSLPTGPRTLYQCRDPEGLCQLFGVVTRNETYISSST